MNISNSDLPSNQKFGFFFASIFLISSIYFFFNNAQVVSLAFFLLSLIFVVVGSLRSSLLLPLNKLWMRFGMLHGMIVSPIVLAILFFFIFTPIAIVMRMFHRDELMLKPSNADSFWRLRDQHSPNAKSFAQQF